MELTKHQKFKIQQVKRSSIKEHPQNPRRISDENKKKLRGKLKEVGLLQPLIINKTTGYLISGHQRLASLDALEKYKDGVNDYLLDVAIVNLPVKEELEMLVFFNNASGQGDWDVEKLGELAGSADWNEMGFERADLEMMFEGDSRFGNLFEEERVSVSEAKGDLENIKEARKANKEKMEVAQSIDYYVTIVCKDQIEKEKLMKHLNIPKGEIYISPGEILSLVRK